MMLSEIETEFGIKREAPGLERPLRSGSRKPRHLTRRSEF
ncbi:hypothetical protein X759_25185 [Mesorhizobium sp. LSHC420B00]|nr:hypothetical protein X759_25185 [Mesorhizobium sp. LSHC420B00]